MKKKIIYLLGGLLVLGFLVFMRTLFFDFGTTSVEEIKVKDGLFYDDQGDVFSGTLKAEMEDLNTLIELTQGIFPAELFSGLRFSQNLVSLPPEFIASQKGIILHINMENGQATGESQIYYDLREGDNTVLDKEIDKGFWYYAGYLFNNRINLATVSFKDGALEGSSYLIKPSISSEEIKLIEVHFNKNKPDYIKRFYDTGELKRINNYQNFVKHDLQQEFYKDGLINCEVYFDNGRRVSEKLYYQHPNNLRREAQYNSFEMAESILEYYPNGEKLYIKNDSVTKEWYSNGDVKLWITKDTVLLHLPKGEIKTYHTNGQLYSHYVYDQNGKENGPYSIYYDNGELWEQGTMKDGENHGNLKKWYNNKQLAEDHQIVNGNIEGKFVRYYDDGQLWKEFHYKDGELHGAYKKWWKNGQVAEDHQMVNGLIDGEYIRYYDNGQMWRKFSYKNGDLIGEATTWWANGQMASKCDYSSGNKKCQKWDDKGKLLD